MSENEIAEQIAAEFLAADRLSIDIHRLTSLFALLGQLGWSIASQDSKNRNRYHLYGQARDRFDAENIPRKQLLEHLNSPTEKHYLHESSQLVIWRSQEPSPLPQPQSPLTKRESEIHNLLLDGLTLPQVARELGISPRTAEKHAQNLYKKMGVHNYNELLFRH
ncbi:helix-turn-helix transcriptional regulator [Pelagicoccus sp. SDUM812005]|uniref:helix-turn-helix transcriptional regulator n=1 Tax=Pelagicoccus sp. SDUM812005 TaxID=3041257 RepID=UPI00280DA24D|nr:helix-turn-helix transcriptional regulator [Pelagicoccus sp. SDUM812005]MDQ8182595.1 helix-turn-helix transcriptional regulator [Pelagicoccus sp. SDUM812005]